MPRRSTSSSSSQGADVSAAGLRVGVKGGGCSGFQYNLAFDERRDGDEVFEASGLKVYVDQASLPYVKGSVIDYVESLTSAGLPGQQPQRRRRLRLRLVLPRRRRAGVLGGLTRGT